jgi:hypothetical protein
MEMAQMMELLLAKMTAWAEKLDAMRDDIKTNQAKTDVNLKEMMVRMDANMESMQKRMDANNILL